MRRLWRYVRPHRMLGVTGLGLLLVSSLNDLAGPYFTQQAIDHYIRPGRLNGYERLAGLWLLVLFVNFLARYGQSYVMNLLGQRVMFDMRNAIFSHLQRMSLPFFDHNPVGVLVTRMTNDVDALNQLLTSGLVAVIGDLFSLVVIAGFMLWVNWQLALVVFAIMPVVMGVTLLMRHQMRDVFRAIRPRMERIFSILDEPASDVDAPGVGRMDAVNGAISLEKVWFAYQGEDWVLKDVSLQIAPGEKVAIVGATGAGKTSLISLLTRFYELQQGVIRVDSRDITTIDRADLRRHIGVVLQDPFIFTGTVADNIRLGQAMPAAQVEAAARAVNADRFIRRLPRGYEQELHERGSDLSTGQKQLLAFARALAFNPEILMVLDEATANVDTETELIIQASLLKLMEGRTSIIIAHRLSTIRHVDRIIVLHKGRVVETGTHAELLARRGVYFRLYELQYKDQAPALSA